MRRRPERAFLDLPRLDAPETARPGVVAVLGLPQGARYGDELWPNPQAAAPDAVRAASDEILYAPGHWDFDIDGLDLRGPPPVAVDLGDIVGDDPKAAYAEAEATVAALARAGARPLCLGGDHGVTIPALRGVAAVADRPVTLVQIDAHLDWRDEVGGEREGYSSPIRRASELPQVAAIHQIGVRSRGSARAAELEAALAYGARITLAETVLELGVAPVLASIVDGGPYYLTVDLDALDPSVAPGVMGREPGGLTFHHLRRLIHGLAAKGEILGADLVELAPARDIDGMATLVAGRLALNLIAALHRSRAAGDPR